MYIHAVDDASFVSSSRDRISATVLLSALPLPVNDLAGENRAKSANLRNEPLCRIGPCGQILQLRKFFSSYSFKRDLIA